MTISNFKIKKLNKNIGKLKDKLKEFLISKSIEVNDNLTLLELIELIPMQLIQPINLYQSLGGHTAVNINNKEIIFGGGSNNIQKLYDINSNIFVSKQNYPYTVTENDGAKYGDTIYYCGGRGSGTVANSTYAYTIDTDTFTAKVNLPIGLSNHTFVATKDQFLLSGGLRANSSTTTVANQYIFNANDNVFSAKSNMRVAADRHATSHIQDNQVLINGGNETNNRFVNYIFDIESDSSTQKINLTVNRHDHKSLKISDNLILINGGTDDTGNTTQIFDVDTNVFINKKASPKTWIYHTLSRIGSNFLLSGGDNSQWSYSYKTDTYLGS